MPKCLAVLMMFALLCGLSGCGAKEKSNINTGSVLVESNQSNTDSDLYEKYQSYTVDQNKCIIDSKTGSVINDSGLAVDGSGNIILTDSGKIVVTAEQVAKNKSNLDIISSKTASQASSTVSKSTQSSSSTTTSKPKSSSSVTKTTSTSSTQAINKNLDPISGEKLWVFFTTSRQNFGSTGGIAFKIKLNQGASAIIYRRAYSPLSSWQYPIHPDDVLDTFNGVDYIAVCWGQYNASYSINNDIVTVGISDYDATGHNWASDKLTLKRTGNNTLQLISYTGTECDLKPGDIFER